MTEPRATRERWLATLAFSIRDGATLTGKDCEELHALLSPASETALTDDELIDEIDKKLAVEGRTLSAESAPSFAEWMDTRFTGDWTKGKFSAPDMSEAFVAGLRKAAPSSESALEYQRLRGLIDARLRSYENSGDPAVKEGDAIAHSELSDLLAAFDAGEGAVSATAARWIPVGEQLPHVYTTVAVCDHDDRGSGSLNDDGSWQWDFSPRTPLFWMPLPDLPSAATDSRGES